MRIKPYTYECECGSTMLRSAIPNHLAMEMVWCSNRTCPNLHRRRFVTLPEVVEVEAPDDSTGKSEGTGAQSA